MTKTETADVEATEALREMGYDVATPEGTFYLFPRSPLPDDEAARVAFERALAPSH